MRPIRPPPLRWGNPSFTLTTLGVRVTRPLRPA